MKKEFYTMPAGGTRVTEDTVVETSAEHRLYAHWSVIPQESRDSGGHSGGHSGGGFSGHSHTSGKF